MLIQLPRALAASYGSLGYAASTDATRPVLGAIHIQTFAHSATQAAMVMTATDSHVLAQQGVELGVNDPEAKAWAAFDPEVETEESRQVDVLVEAKAFIKAVKDAIGTKRSGDLPVYLDISDDKVTVEGSAGGSILRPVDGSFPKTGSIIPAWFTHDNGLMPHPKRLDELGEADGLKLPAIGISAFGRILRAADDLSASAAGHGRIPLRMSTANPERDTSLGPWCLTRTHSDDGSWFVGLVMPVRV